MRPFGSIRRVDEVGRIVLPTELRRMFNLKEKKDSVEIFIEDDKIILKKYNPSCVFCGISDDIIEYKSARVCRTCAEKVTEVFEKK